MQGGIRWVGCRSLLTTQLSEDECTLDVWENGRERENSTHIHIEKLKLL